MNAQTERNPCDNAEAEGFVKAPKIEAVIEWRTRILTGAAAIFRDSFRDSSRSTTAVFAPLAI
jgi:hypothetical protein